MPTDISRFERQVANAHIQVNSFGKEFDGALIRSGECGDRTKNNEFGRYNTYLNSYIARGDMKRAQSLISETIDPLEKESAYFYGPLQCLGPTIQTTLAYMAMSLVVEAQFLRSARHGEKLKERLLALQHQEQKYGVRTQLNRISSLDGAVREAAAKLPELGELLTARRFPAIQAESADVIRSICRYL
jgi:hypothetical protein